MQGEARNDISLKWDDIAIEPLAFKIWNKSFLVPAMEIIDWRALAYFWQ